VASTPVTATTMGAGHQPAGGEGGANAPGAPQEPGPGAGTRPGDLQASASDPSLGPSPAVADASPTEPDVPTLGSDADWMDRICPYLLSEDGTYRSTEPDPDHRCMAQDPPGTLPIAFQERYCLTERHVRCEMYKYAQSAREVALGGQEGVPPAQVSSARFRPTVRSVPLTLGPSRGATSSDAARKRPTGLLVATGIGLVLVLLVLLALALNGFGGSTGADASPSPPLATVAPSTLPPPTPEPTPDITAGPDSSQAAATGPVGGEPLLIRYEVQEGEALVRIAETFGTSRNRILAANEGMRERDPYTEAGDIIIVPVSATMTTEEIEAQPGFVGYIE
jgi:hypothetical protein